MCKKKFQCEIKELQKSIRNEELILMRIMTSVFVMNARRISSAKNNRYRFKLLNSGSKYFTKIYRVWRISLANSILAAINAIVPDWEVRERRKHACMCVYMDVRAHARGCAMYRGVEEKNWIGHGHVVLRSLSFSLLSETKKEPIWEPMRRQRRRWGKRRKGSTS